MRSIILINCYIPLCYTYEKNSKENKLLPTLEEVTYLYCPCFFFCMSQPSFRSKYSANYFGVQSDTNLL